MNRLTTKNISHYLLDRGFIDFEDILHGDFLVTQIQNRNSIFKILTHKKEGVFVKQLLLEDPQNKYLMQRDATTNYLLHNATCYKEVKQYIPDYYGYDPNNQILVTSYFKEAKNLYELYFSSKSISTSYLKQMAHILASFHKISYNEALNYKSSLFFPKQIPWAFNMGSEPSYTNPLAVFIRKEKELVHLLDACMQQWEIQCLIHGDVKWANFIVDNDSDQLKIIDWEIADFGDPIWDVAGVFQSFLTYWVFTFDNEQLTHNQVKGFDDISIHQMKVDLQVFWQEYVKMIQPENEEAQLKKAIQYTAARMLQTAFEGNMQHAKLLPNSARITQMAFHFLDNPEKIINYLFSPTTTTS